jgi:antitoxin ParD1/3/4
VGKMMTLNVRVTGPLGEFVESRIGDNGTYENVSEYVRDLIRQDRDRSENAEIDRLKAELAVAFAAPDESYAPLTAAEVIARNQRG